jgi:hypothetical protein
MSMVETSVPIAAAPVARATALLSQAPNDVVEIGLLLPTNWATTLIALSKERHQTVGQILRAIIGNALHDTAARV